VLLAKLLNGLDVAGDGLQRRDGAAGLAMEGVEGVADGEGFAGLSGVSLAASEPAASSLTRASAKDSSPAGPP